MKKYLIHFMSIDTPSVEDDGVSAGTNFGIHPQAFDTKEQAEEYLEKEMIPQDQANLESCYGIDEEPDLADNYEFSVEDASYGRKQLVVYDAIGGNACNELNTTIYEIVEVEF
jgi:hypothetical protein